MLGSACCLSHPSHKSWTKLQSWESVSLIVGRSFVFNKLQHTSDLFQCYWGLGYSKWKCFPVPEARSHFTCFETWDPILLSTPELWGMKFCLWSSALRLRPCCWDTYSCQGCFSGLTAWVPACHLCQDSSPSPHAVSPDTLIGPSWSSDPTDLLHTRPRHGWWKCWILPEPYHPRKK